MKSYGIAVFVFVFVLLSRSYCENESSNDISASSTSSTESQEPQIASSETENSIPKSNHPKKQRKAKSSNTPSTPTTVVTSSEISKSTDEDETKLSKTTADLSKAAGIDVDRIRHLGAVLSVLADQVIPALLDNSDKLSQAEVRLRSIAERSSFIPLVTTAFNNNNKETKCDCK